MTLTTNILLTLGSVCSLFLAIYWVVGLLQIRASLGQLPTARDGLALAAANPPAASVCVVVPAHNEEAVIATLIRSLRAQEYPNLRVVLALDRCTDDTVEIARREIADDARFTIVHVRGCPKRWAGKVNAVWRGVFRSGALDADLLLFADADTIFDPGCVRASVALLEDRKLDLLSLVSTLTHDRWFELLAQPAAGLELLRQYPLLKSNRENDRRPFANGQFMLFRKSTYVAIQGHPLVHAEILEDLAFALNVDRLRYRPGVLLADGMLTCRMYHSWPEFKKGWMRIFSEAASRKPDRLRVSAWSLRGILTALPTAAMLTLAGGMTLAPERLWPWLGQVATILSGVALAVWLVAMVTIVRLGKGPAWTALATPIGGWLVGGIMLRAARNLERGRPTEWGNKQYTRDAR
ncbi:MAG: glycosyltransferase [Planctomycetota bacterium]